MPSRETGNTRTNRSRRNGKGRLRFGLLYVTLPTTFGSAFINTRASFFQDSPRKFSRQPVSCSGRGFRTPTRRPVGPTNRSPRRPACHLRMRRRAQANVAPIPKRCQLQPIATPYRFERFQALAQLARRNRDAPRPIGRWRRRHKRVSSWRLFRAARIADVAGPSTPRTS